VVGAAAARDHARGTAGLLDKTVKMGGEGLMLHRGASLYLGGATATC
jgi:hypothetical protein